MFSQKMSISNNKIYLLLLLLLIQCIPLIIQAEEVPTCSISFSPKILKLGEELTETSTTTGIVTKITINSSKPQKGTSKNLESTEVIKIGDEYFDSFLGSQSGNFWPQRIIGESIDTWIVEGPGGSSSCTRSFKMIPNNDWNDKESIIFSHPITYHTTDSFNVKSCPTSQCAIKNWGGWEDSNDITIIKKNNGYYYATTTGYFNTGIYASKPTTNTDSGWLLPEVVPLEVRQKLENQINNTTLKEIISPEKIIVSEITTTNEQLNSDVINIPKKETPQTNNSYFIYKLIGFFLVIYGIRYIKLVFEKYKSKNSQKARENNGKKQRKNYEQTKEEEKNNDFNSKKTNYQKPNNGQPEDIKKLYYRLLKNYHPDFAQSEEDKRFRTNLTAKIINAYKVGDIDTLKMFE